jgi:ferrochelatase
LINKCNDKIENYKTYQVMRYTPPFAKEIISQMKKDGIKEVLLLPL